MRILVSGSIAYDRIMNFPGCFEDFILPEQIHKLNVSFAVKELVETYGGAAGNIVYSLNLLGEQPCLIGAAGHDFGKYRERLERLKISTAGIKVYEKVPTASAYIITDEKDNQISGFYAGAMVFYGQKPKVKKGDLAIISPGNPNEELDLADLYSKNGVPFIFDPGQQIIQFSKNQLRQLIKLAGIYIVNDYELSLTLKITGYDKKILLRNSGVLITTLGEKGSSIEIAQSAKSERVDIDPVKVKALDPTGAGDAYRSGMIKGLALSGLELKPANYLKFDWLKIGQIASLAAAYAVEHHGTQLHQYSFQQFKEKYQKAYKSKI